MIELDAKPIQTAIIGRLEEYVLRYFDAIELSDAKKLVEGFREHVERNPIAPVIVEETVVRQYQRDRDVAIERAEKAEAKLASHHLYKAVEALITEADAADAVFPNALSVAFRNVAYAYGAETVAVDDAERELATWPQRASNLLDTVEKPGSIPEGSPGSLHRRAWELGKRLRDETARLVEQSDSLVKKAFASLRFHLASLKMDPVDLEVVLDHIDVYAESYKSALLVPPSLPIEENVADKPTVQIAGYDVYSWRPGPANSGEKCTEVHLVLPFNGENFCASVALRLKTARGLDQLVGSLLQHRKDVWP